MLQPDWLVVLSLSGFFILLGLVAVILGKVEEKRYYNSVTQRPDLREFLEHTPEQAEPGALRIGGWGAIAVGVVIAVAGVGFRLWG